MDASINRHYQKFLGAEPYSVDSMLVYYSALAGLPMPPLPESRTHICKLLVEHAKQGVEGSNFRKDWIPILYVKLDDWWTCFHSDTETTFQHPLLEPIPAFLESHKHWKPKPNLLSMVMGGFGTGKCCIM